MGFNGSGDYLSVHPTELKFPFELRKQSSCALELTSKTDEHVAFKVKTTNPRKYSVRPNSGVIAPGTSSNVTVNMQALKEMPADMQCKDKFLIQTVVIGAGATTKDITPQTFDREDGKIVGEYKLRVAYIPANPPSPVPEEPEEESSTLISEEVKNSSEADLTSEEVQNSAEAALINEEVKNTAEAFARSFSESSGRSAHPEDWPLISKLMEEKTLATEQNQKLYHEVEKMKRDVNKGRACRVSLFVVLLMGLIGVLIGYFLKMN